MSNFATSYSPGYAGRCSTAGVAKAIQPLTCTHLTLRFFMVFREIGPFYIEPTSRYSWLMVHLSESSRKTATRAVVARYRGKRMMGAASWKQDERKPPDRDSKTVDCLVE